MKRMYWSLALLCFLLCFVVSGYAYTVDEIYTNFKTAYEKSKNFSAEFEEITLYKTRKSIAHGQFTFGKPNLLRKEYVAPKDPQKIIKTIVLDGAYVWSYAQVINQVNKQKLSKSQRRELIPGIGESLEGLSENWNMKLVPDEAANSKGVHQIQLTPKDRLVNRADSNVKEILEIWVKEGEWLPVQFGHVIVYEDGSRRNVIMKLSKIQRDKELPPNVFKFVIPKNAEVIDFTEN